MEYKGGLTGLSLRDYGSKIEHMDGENSSMPKETFMRENGKMIRQMGRAFISEQRDQNMKAMYF